MAGDEELTILTGQVGDQFQRIDGNVCKWRWADGLRLENA